MVGWVAGHPSHHWGPVSWHSLAVSLGAGPKRSGFTSSAWMRRGPWCSKNAAPAGGARVMASLRPRRSKVRTALVHKSRGRQTVPGSGPVAAAAIMAASGEATQFTYGRQGPPGRGWSCEHTRPLARSTPRDQPARGHLPPPLEGPLGSSHMLPGRHEVKLF
jgi:hypothetical protein